MNMEITKIDDLGDEMIVTMRIEKPKHCVFCPFASEGLECAIMDDPYLFDFDANRMCPLGRYEFVSTTEKERRWKLEQLGHVVRNLERYDSIAWLPIHSKEWYIERKKSLEDELGLGGDQ